MLVCARIDWNCKLLSDIHEFYHPPKETLKALTWLEQRFGLRCFCFNPTFHADEDSVASFLAHRETAIASFLKVASELSSEIRTPIKILEGSSVLLSEGLHAIFQLKKLAIPFGSDQYLPIMLPMCEHCDWIDLELNRLLYTAKCKLMFLSFEIACILYPSDVLDKILRISGAVYQFNYSSLANPKMRAVIKTLLARRATVLFGTSLNLVGKIYHYELDYFLETAQKEFEDYEFTQLMKYALKTPPRHPKSYRITSLA